MVRLTELKEKNLENPNSRLTKLFRILERRFYGKKPTSTPYTMFWGDYELIKSRLGIDLRKAMSKKSEIKSIKDGFKNSYIILSYKQYTTHLFFEDFIEELHLKKVGPKISTPQQSSLVKIIKKLNDISDIESINPNRCLFIDTETTGLGKADHVIELGVVDDQENIIFDSLLQPKRARKIHIKAYEAHGISNEDLIGKPRLIDIQEQVEHLFKDKYAVFYNADFDVRKILHSSKGDIFNGCKGVICFMRLFAEGKGRWIKLTKACEQLNVEYHDVPNHRASGDSIKLARLYKEWYKQQSLLLNLDKSNKAGQ